MNKREQLREVLACGLLGAMVLVAVAYRLTLPKHPDWVYEAQARVSSRPQVVLFAREIQGGQRIDRNDPYLPPLDVEASHGRSVNFERCRVAVDVNSQSGRVRRLIYNDPLTLFAVQVDSKRWDADETLLEDLACVFAAGDVRRTVVYPVLDEHGAEIGRWRHGRYLVKP